MGLDGFTFTRDGSAGESLAIDQSSATAVTEGTANAAATARDGSTTLALAAVDANATSVGEVGSIAIAMAQDANTSNATAELGTAVPVTTE